MTALLISGGGRGIRTPERVTPLTVFKTAAFNHSAIPPSLSYPISLCDCTIYVVQQLCNGVSASHAGPSGAYRVGAHHGNRKRRPSPAMSFTIESRWPRSTAGFHAARRSLRGAIRRGWPSGHGRRYGGAWNRGKSGSYGPIGSQLTDRTAGLDSRFVDLMATAEGCRTAQPSLAPKSAVT